MARRLWLVASILCVGLGANAFAQLPESERRLVTDPNLLESMGFPRNARNVYLATNLARPVASEVPQDWGSFVHYTPQAARTFIGIQNRVGTPWEYTSGDADCCQSLTRKGAETFADSQLDLPTGVRIDAIRWWANDSNDGANLVFFVFETCQPGFGAGDPVTTTIASGGSTGSSGAKSDILDLTPGITVNNRDCFYVARVRFDDTVDLSLNKLRVQWARQVSPAPAVATFSDVPTGHMFFQFVEALSASGITAGCGGGNYCPDGPLTRGQMAAFLSIALGLYFQ